MLYYLREYAIKVVKISDINIVKSVMCYMKTFGMTTMYVIFWRSTTATPQVHVFVALRQRIHVSQRDRLHRHQTTATKMTSIRKLSRSKSERMRSLRVT